MQSYNPAKVYLLDHAREELVAYMAQLGQEKYRANQLFHAIYAQLLPDFDDLSTFSKNLRHQLNESTTLRSFTLLETVKSSRDNTKKFLWQLNDGKTIESVIIYEGKRVTFCISSQVGCVLDCKFCATGQMGFLRNLTSGEILEQVILMKQEAENLPTNIVFMGMGEPLLNMRNVLKASFILSDPRGLSFSQKKITISTSGIIPGIRKLADLNSPFSLAISLNALFEEKRRRIMPISYQYPLEDLRKSIHYYVHKTKKRVTFEYILIADINDTREDAEALVKFTSQLPCKINLIPCNSNLALFNAPSIENIQWFNEFLNKHKRTATVRLRKGEEIQAACGQLSAKNSVGIGTKIPVPVSD
jgi:23S rRNA (adenine2503-C2)-methyltransferase